MAEQYRELIEKFIRNNPRFSGNEDLFEDFCSETFKRCYKILSTNTNIVNFEAYLSKIASSAILDVLKTSGRIRKQKSNYVKIHTEAITNQYTTDENNEIIYDIEDPSPTVEESLIKQEEIRNIRQTLKILDMENQNKQYLTIFKLRYIDEKKQNEIASMLGISQGEVCKRITDLGKKVIARIHST